MRGFLRESGNGSNREKLSEESSWSEFRYPGLTAAMRSYVPGAKVRSAGTLLLICLLIRCWVCFSQAVADSPVPTPAETPSADSFTFVRIQYDSSGGFGESWYSYEGRDWQRWETDYPRGEKNLLFRLNQLTSMSVNNEPIVLRLTDKRLDDYPFIFMSDVGWQQLSEGEAQCLDGYLRKGGFLWIDDFWGDAEWQNLLRNTQLIGRDWKWQEIPSDHDIMNCVYPLKECPQIPARIFYESTGQEYDPPSVHRSPSGGTNGMRQVHCMGLFDEDGRICAIATHNTDIADGWEREGEDHEFFTRFSVKSYAMTINVISYALTH